MFASEAEAYLREAPLRRSQQKAGYLLCPQT
jgi:hypothetical protein